MQNDIQERAVGRWYGILSALGVDSRFLRNKHGPCPFCGEGKDRFRWDNKAGKGTFICNKCGAGDGFELLKRLKGWDFKQAADEVERIVGGIRRVEPRAAVSPEGQRAAMQKRWKQCHPVMDSDDPVALYLKRRVGIGSLAVPQILRSAPDRPAMVALMQAPDGRATMVHTTFLTWDGRKAQMDNPRLMMPGTIADGAAVRLTETGEELGIAEGIETALSATALTGVPCWAALNRVLLQKWIAPAGVKRVVIFGDSDAKFDGQAAAFALASRLSRGNQIDVDVRIPPKIGEDWNDVWLQKEAVA
jgi:putative DNA primase/helicase